MTDITDAGPRLKAMNDRLLIGGGMRQTDAEYRAEIGELLEKAEAEITRLRLTDAEREAITVACGDSSQWGRPHVATLMRLLERMEVGDD